MTSPPVTAATDEVPRELPDEVLGRLVRGVWCRWAREQPDAKASWLVPWDGLDEGQREVDIRIGRAVAKAATLAERAKLQPAIDRVAHLAVAAQEKAVENAVAAERQRILAEAAKLRRSFQGVAKNVIAYGDLAALLGAQP